MRTANKESSDSLWFQAAKWFVEHPMRKAGRRLIEMVGRRHGADRARLFALDERRANFVLRFEWRADRLDAASGDGATPAPGLLTGDGSQPATTATPGASSPASTPSANAAPGGSKPRAPRMEEAAKLLLRLAGKRLAHDDELYLRSSGKFPRRHATLRPPLRALGCSNYYATAIREGGELVGFLEFQTLKRGDTTTQADDTAALGELGDAHAPDEEAEIYELNLPDGDEPDDTDEPDDAEPDDATGADNEAGDDLDDESADGDTSHRRDARAASGNTLAGDTPADAAHSTAPAKDTPATAKPAPQHWPRAVRREMALAAELIGGALKALAIQEAVEEAQTITVEQGSTLHNIPVRQIVRIEARGNASRVILTDGRELLTWRSLDVWAPLLADTPFTRVHRSHFVNRQHILRSRSKRGHWKLTLRDQKEIPVGPTYHEAFTKSLAAA